MYYRDRQMEEWVRAIRRDKHTLAFVYSSAMAQYVLADGTAPRVMDFVDADSLKWQAYAQGMRWPMSAFYRREGRSLLNFERTICQRFEATILVSKPEADLFARIAGVDRDRVTAVTNGVDADYFSPEHTFDDPYGGSGNTALCFTGLMDYRPNIDAVVWFVREVLPLIKRSVPSATFWIVGANPHKRVRELGGDPGVFVTGRVRDTRPFLAHAGVAVAPLRIARGIQNKVLEAMAMGRPVVATTAAFEGLDATPGEHLLVAESADGFAAAVQQVLAGATTHHMGASARRAVQSRYRWTDRFAQLDEVLERVGWGLRSSTPTSDPVTAAAGWVH
jgi:sugar transferase (PEP-CTERM/EpsH1 system associated)